MQFPTYFEEVNLVLVQNLYIYSTVFMNQLVQQHYQVNIDTQVYKITTNYGLGTEDRQQV